jgi:hypothetical protein
MFDADGRSALARTGTPRNSGTPGTLNSFSSLARALTKLSSACWRFDRNFGPMQLRANHVLPGSFGSALGWRQLRSLSYSEQKSEYLAGAKGGSGQAFGKERGG